MEILAQCVMIDIWQVSLNRKKYHISCTYQCLVSDKLNSQLKILLQTHSLTICVPSTSHCWLLTTLDCQAGSSMMMMSRKVMFAR